MKHFDIDCGSRKMMKVNGFMEICVSLLLLLCFTPVKPEIRPGQIDYKYPNDAERENALEDRTFIPDNCVLMDIASYYPLDVMTTNIKHFVTIPRLQDGVPASLGRYNRNIGKNRAPSITPYPNWNWHKEPEKCRENRIVSAFSVQVDKYQRLWVLDSGHIKNEIICKPQVLIFDLHSNNLLQRYEIPMDQLLPESLLVSIAVEPAKNRKTTGYAYISDFTGKALIVYDSDKNDSWRVTNDYVERDELQLENDILGLDLGLSDNKLNLYYYSVAKKMCKYVQLEFLKDKSNFVGEPKSRPENSAEEINAFPNQTVGVAILSTKRKETIFFTSLDDKRIEYGHIGNKYSKLIPEENWIPIALNIVKNNRRRRQELWVLSKRSSPYETIFTINLHDLSKKKKKMKKGNRKM